MDIYLDHFVELGLEGLPMHFLIENDGLVFQLLPLTTNPLSYSQNWASAMVLGLEGKANSQAEAKEKLHRAAGSVPLSYRHRCHMVRHFLGKSALIL